MTTMAQVQRRPRPVFCVVESTYRDLALAEAVCAGRFTHAGVTVELGAEPDWLTAALPSDAEWRIEWSKFYYGLDLAAAFTQTGDRAFLDAWERLVRSWIRQVPIGRDPVGRDPVGRDPSDVVGRRIQNWLYAWSAFAASPAFPGLTEGADDEIFESLVAQVEHLRRNLTPERNHRTLELYALVVAALAMPELDRDGLLDFAIDALERNLLDDVRADGVHREHSTHYHMVALRSYLGALENARRFGISLSGAYRERLALACEFAAHCRRPDGSIPALSDSDTGDYAELLELAAELLDRPDLVAPDRTSASFPDGGYYVQRSDWTRDARFLIFDCGPVGDGGHGHYDALSVEIAAGGRPLVVDPGRYTYSEEAPNWRRWFKGTAAHNTVSVDGLDQTPYRSGKPKGRVARARLVERVSAPGVATPGVATPGVATPGLDVLHGEVESPCYDAVHTRRVLFVAAEYWIVADTLRGASPHRYDLRYHLSDEAWGRTALEPRDGGSVVTAPGVALVFDRDRGVRIEPGWVSPRYGIKHPAPVVSVAVERCYRATFVALVVPTVEGRRAPELVVRSRRAETGGVSVVEVRGTGPDGSATDLVAWCDTPRKFDLGETRALGTAAWVRTNGSAAGGLR